MRLWAAVSTLALAACAVSEDASDASSEPTAEMIAQKNQVLACAVALVATGQIAPASASDSIAFSNNEFLAYTVRIDGVEVSEEGYDKIDQCIAEAE
jgi:hypothetical protein